MSAIDAAGLYTGLNLIILLALGFHVSLGRNKKKVSLGSGGDSAMESRIRAHGNASEWIPGAMIGLILLALMGASAFLIHGIGLIFTIGRGVHGFAMATNAPPGPARMIGALITYATYGVLGVGLFYYALAV